MAASCADAPYENGCAWAIERGQRTNLLREHVPLEFGEIFHGPDIISPPCALLPADSLRVQHLRNRARNLLILELYPPLGEVGFLGGGVLSAQVCPLCIYNTRISGTHMVVTHWAETRLPAVGKPSRSPRAGPEDGGP